MSSTLNADELGAKGEARFKEICADARLICNQADRDRTGWDFIVEFPFEPHAADLSFEQREPALSCHVQVKTLQAKNDGLKLRLSSAERLAKELKPSFIYVFKVNAALEFTGARLIHILDSPLARILKRLRKEDPLDKRGLNKKHISLSAKAFGTELTPSGAALRSALASACGQGMSEYIAAKSTQLSTLGFEPRPYELKATLAFDTVDDLIDSFLGLKTDIAATELSLSVTRFGIKKPLTMGSAEGRLSIRPQSIDTCTITARADATSTPAVFRGKVFFPIVPGVPREQLKIVFDVDLFHISVTSQRFSLTTRDDFSLLPPTRWIAYWKLMLLMAQGAGSIEIASDTTAIRSTMKITPNSSSLDQGECAYWLSLFEKASRVLSAAGVLDEPQISMAEIQRSREVIHSAFSLLNPQSGNASAVLVTTFDDRVPTPYATEMLFADFLRLGSVDVGWYGVGTFLGSREEANIKWTCNHVSLKGIVRFNGFPADYERMIEAAKAETRCQTVWSREPA